MATMFVRHNVTDYAKWRKVYDDLAPVQERFGVTAKAVYRSADDPTDVTVTHEFGSVDAARVFAGSDELKGAMATAGVAGPPTIWFADRS